MVKVLSKSTASYDRGDKFYKYRQLPSLKEYLLIDQENPVVESYDRQAENVWEISRVAGLEETLTIKYLGIKMLMKEVYLRVGLNGGED